MNINCFLLFISSLFFVLLPISVHAEQTKETFLYGYCVHLGQPWNKAYSSRQDVKEKIEELGATSFRDDLPWDIRQATSLDTIPNSLKKLSFGINNIHARPLLILMGDRSYLHDGQPTHDDTREIYATYAQQAAFALENANPIYEIWNEWNLGAWNMGNKPGSAEDYVKLVKKTYPRIKNVSPNALVLAGVAGGDRTWDWTQQAVALGLMDYADGLSVHAYNNCIEPGKETGVEVLDRLLKLREKVKAAYPKKDVPIYLTETGWFGEPATCKGQSETVARDGVAQLLLAAPTFSWLKGIWFYELFDEGTSPENREHHFGFYRTDKTMKPAGCAAKDVWSFIADGQPLNLTHPYSGVTMAAYRMQDNIVRVGIWQTAPSENQVYEVLIPQESKHRPICGAPSLTSGDTVRLSRTPLLLEIPEQQIPLIFKK